MFPLKLLLQTGGVLTRYAGAKDRAFISGLCLDVLRQKKSLNAHMQDNTPRSAVLATLRHVWAYDVDEIQAAACEEPHGMGALSERELERLKLAITKEGASAGDYPEWLDPYVERAFGGQAHQEMKAFCARADIDLRVNTLKSSQEKTLAALKSVKAETIPVLKTANAHSRT